MPRTKSMSKADAKQTVLDAFSTRDFRALLTAYAKQHKSVTKAISQFDMQTLEATLAKNHVNDYCPRCGSTIVVKNGLYKNGLQRFHCTACNHNYNRLTNTFLEKTSFSYEYWINLIKMMFDDTAILSIQQTITDDDVAPSIHENTIFFHLHKVMNATSTLQPNLSGIVEIDECHIHEAQKGSKELVNFLDDGTLRAARKNKEPAEYGVMGAEFVTIICAVDRNRNYFAKVSGLGKFDIKTFEEYVAPHLSDCKLLCSDANIVYSQYTKKYHIPHYIRPSDYKGRYIECMLTNEFETYYHDQKLDYIINAPRIGSYNAFTKYRDDNKLHINTVNSFHSDLKQRLVYKRRSISVEYVQHYVDWLVYCKNITKQLGHIPISQKDAEYVFNDLVKNAKNTTFQQIANLKPTILRKPSKQFTTKLIENTKDARKRGREKFEFTPETVDNSFSIRKQLEILPLFVLKEMGKDLKIANYSKAKQGKTLLLRQSLEKHTDIEDELNKMRIKYGKEHVEI